MLICQLILFHKFLNFGFEAHSFPLFSRHQYENNDEITDKPHQKIVLKMFWDL
jgi:hypothetical protein